MDKKRLMQYKAFMREQPKLEKEIDRLYDRLNEVPVVSGKVTKSGDDFPYIEEHLTVQMTEPKAAEEIKKQIRIKGKRLDMVEQERTEIEKFIAGIPDSLDRQIFELSFLDGKKQCEVANEIGMERSSISKRINSFLQLSHNSQK
ncbi:sigma-70 RNA polymerase sigma factor region 4 domain-containing protein [Novisyntrophococcus fermenticellae]|uniref:sigma-70 family RNA polymerase sigma factor n=1 Tax=Novisyntrophococcus fermenticellae TaxID=2068655 RepID=UPI001E414CB2|nr:sigma-70 family RNA polymerase sigma factor [Novisyntrophococcus fermenticellae]